MIRIRWHCTSACGFFPRIAYDHEPLYRFAQEVIPRLRSP